MQGKEVVGSGRRATLADSVVTIAPVAPGRMTVSVIARDEGGRATTLPVPVTVYPSNRPPAARNPADRKIRIDRPPLQSFYCGPWSERGNMRADRVL